MPDDIRWMTYTELAEALGIGGDSARNLVRRKRWPRQMGNDGMTRVGVPIEHIHMRETDDRGTDDPVDPPIDGALDGGTVVAILTNHINRLERELQTLKEEHSAERGRLQGEHETERGRLLLEINGLRSERDAERLRAAQVEALQTVLDAERQRVEDLRADRDALRADRDRWAAQADKLAEPAEPSEPRRRGWWPFRKTG